MGKKKRYRKNKSWDSNKKFKKNEPYIPPSADEVSFFSFFINNDVKFNIL